MYNKECLKWIIPSVKTGSVSLDKNVDNFRIEKAKEQLQLPWVSEEKIIEYVNCFLESINMKKIEKPLVIPKKTIIRRIEYAKIIPKPNKKDDIVWIKFSKKNTTKEHNKRIISVIGTSCDIFFTEKTKMKTTAGLINKSLDLEWDEDYVLIFPLIEIPKGLTRSDIESGIGNYLIGQGVPILDFYSHNY